MGRVSAKILCREITLYASKSESSPLIYRATNAKTPLNMDETKKTCPLITNYNTLGYRRTVGVQSMDYSVSLDQYLRRGLSGRSRTRHISLDFLYTSNAVY